MCRSVIQAWDPASAVVIRNLVDGVEAFRRAPKAKPAAQAAGAAHNDAAPQEAQQWSAVLNPVHDMHGSRLPISELKISLEKAAFTPRPSLFIAVVDRSGSMAGSPWRQVQDGLLHMVALSRNNPFVRMQIIAYESSAQVVDIGRNEADAVRIIRGMQAGGGTNFLAAFRRVEEVLGHFTCQDQVTPENAHHNVSNVTVAFLTDGQAEGDRQHLTNTFRTMLAERWTGPISVHAIGFGRDCDKPFLEEMWKTGAQPGSFRYAEPDENCDMLSRKLTSLFEQCSRFSTVTVQLKLVALGRPYSPLQLVPTSANDSSVLEVQFPIGENRRGSYSCWLEEVPEQGDRRVLLSSPFDRDVSIAVLDGYGLPQYKLIQRALLGRWFATLTDALAAELLELSNKRAANNSGAMVLQLHARFLEQKIVALMRQVPDGDGNTQATRERLEILERSAAALAEGAAVNAGQLGDLRFGANYLPALPAAARPPQPQLPAPAAAAPAAIVQLGEHDEAVVRFSRSPKDVPQLGRSPLQNQLLRLLCDWTPAARAALPSVENTTREQLLHRDADGNTLLMLAAYCGHRRLLRELLVAAKRELDVDACRAYVNATNASPAPHETALTLAIKARGFTSCVEALLEAGAQMPSGRRQALTRFCIDRGFSRTAALLSADSTEEVALVANERMSVEFATFTVHRIVRASLQTKANWSSFLTIALRRSAPELVRLVLQTAPPELLPIDVFEHLWELCVLDDTDAEKPRLAELLVEHLRKLWGAAADSRLRALVNEPHPESGDTLLFHAADKGSPQLLALALRLGAHVDAPNKLGNTPLWIACERRWPCIVDALLLQGADPNRPNEKGNPPIITICQKVLESI